MLLEAWLTFIDLGFKVLSAVVMNNGGYECCHLLGKHGAISQKMEIFTFVVLGLQ
jgi:hypothetical protein